MRPLQWWVESAPPGGDRVKVSENLGATLVAPVAPVDTSLPFHPAFCYVILRSMKSSNQAFLPKYLHFLVIFHNEEILLK